jgi:hypothetical protein
MRFEDQSGRDAAGDFEVKKRYWPDFPAAAVLFYNGQNETFDLDFDFPVFASHPSSEGQEFAS